MGSLLSTRRVGTLPLHPGSYVRRMASDLRRLGASGVEVSAVGLGCMQFSNRGFISSAYPALEQSLVDDIVKTAHDGGITWFDTAEVYGRGTSERCLSTGLQHAGVRPGEVTVATKWWPVGRTAADIGRSIATRRAALQPYPVDLYQIHWPIGGFSSLRAEVAAMAGLVEQGVIRAVGVSNFSARQMEQAHAVLAERGIPLASNQVQISLAYRNIERNGVLAAARRLGVTLIGYSPLASGLLTGKFHDNPGVVAGLPWVRRLVSTGLGGGRLSRTRPLVEGLRAVAAEHQATVSQVALAWLTTYYGETVVAIPGASKPQQADEAAGSMRVRLTDRETAFLSDLSSGL